MMAASNPNMPRPFLHSVRGYLPDPFKDVLRRCRAFAGWDRYQKTSWSQEGEDLILDRLLGQRRSGFYVDVGAHHPFRFSNTQLFYRRGWRGINIDAMPGAMEAFRKARPRDINLELAVSSRREVLTFHIFDEPALNTFDPELAQQRASDGNGRRVLRTVELKTSPLTDILGEHLPPHQDIDFMSIDVEGFDLDVLRSNDWERYRPDFVVVENLRNLPDSPSLEDEICSHLRGVDYVPRANLFRSMIFARS